MLAMFFWHSKHKSDDGFILPMEGSRLLHRLYIEGGLSYGYISLHGIQATL